MLIKNMLQKISPERGIPTGSIGMLLSHFTEYLDIEALRLYHRENLFPVLDAADHVLPQAVYRELKEKSISQLDQLGNICTNRMMWIVSNHIEVWRFHEKLRRVYPTDREEREILKLADSNIQLMKGVELAPGFSLSFMEEIREKMEVIVQNSMASRLMEAASAKEKIEPTMTVNAIIKLIHPPDPNSVDLPRLEELVQKFRKHLRAVSQNHKDQKIPISQLGYLLSRFSEYHDVTLLRTNNKMSLFPPPSEDSRFMAYAIYEEFRNKKAKELARMGSLCLNRMMWHIGNYVETWRLHQKFNRVYLPDKTEEEVYALADANMDLMKGKEFPEGMNEKDLNEIRGKIQIIMSNSIMARMTETTTSKLKR
jgi:hypothetical protein